MPSTLARKNPEPVVLPALGLVAPPPIRVQCQHFQGSLAALFEVVRTRKIDLRDIPLYPICEAYFAYLANAPDRNVDEAAAALTALAYLLERKAWLLLPVYEPEPELEEALALPEGLGEEFRYAIEALELFREERSRIYFRTADLGREDYFVPVDVESLDINDLARALDDLLRKAKPDPVEPLNQSRRSLAEQMGIVAKALSNQFKDLPSLIGERFTRADVVWWFLALLELIRLGQARYQIESDTVRFAR